MATLAVNIQPAAHTHTPAHARPHVQAPTSIPIASSSKTFDAEADAFAFARVADSICLIQTDKSYTIPAHSHSTLTPVEIALFRHEFGTMFRFSHSAAVRAADVRILVPISPQHVLVESTGVVFVAREVTDKLLQWTAPRRSQTPTRVARRR